MYTLGAHDIPYSGKVWRAECLANLLFSSVWRKKVWRMNRSAKGLSMVTINLDGFSLANRRRFAKFAKLSPRQTFPLYGSIYLEYISYHCCYVFNVKHLEWSETKWSTQPIKLAANWRKALPSNLTSCLHAWSFCFSYHALSILLLCSCRSILNYVC